MRFFLVFFLLGILCVPSIGQEQYFSMPIRHAFKMSGSFGELRNNHFHAGVDMKSSRGRDGDDIIAAAPGYISRIKVEYGGYGRALYIDHPNGYTTVYAHLMSFMPEIEALVEQHQLESKSYEVDLYPQAGKYTVDREELIGFMGNTGHSYGTHLHFEIRETLSEVPQNPYNFGIGPSDSKFPVMYGILITELGHSLEEVKSTFKSLKKGNNGVHTPSYDMEVSAGKVGVGVQVFDQMDGASNLNGIYDLKMYVDDSLAFHHTMDAVGFHVTRYINSHIDYHAKVDSDKTVTRCYNLPGNILDFYFQNGNGVIDIKEGKSHKIYIEARDYKGNVSSASLTLKGLATANTNSPSYVKRVKQGSNDTVRLGRMNLYFSESSLDRDLYLNYTYEDAGNQVNIELNDDIPLFSPVMMEIDVSHMDSTMWGKLILAHVEKRATSYGGIVKGGVFRASVDRLGSYVLKPDVNAPVIKTISFEPVLKNGGRIIVNIEDDYKTRGSAKDMKMNAYIDGKWVIADYSVVKKNLTIPIRNLALGDHHIQVIATDHSGNRSEWNKTFNVK